MVDSTDGSQRREVSNANAATVPIRMGRRSVLRSAALGTGLLGLAGPARSQRSEGDVSSDVGRGGEGVAGDHDRPRSVMITANGPVEYALTVDGALEPDTYGGDFAADEHDSPEETVEGYRSITNETGPRPENASPTNFRGDRYLFSGRVETFRVSPADPGTAYHVYVDGRNTTVESLREFGDFRDGTHSVMITGNAPVEYTLTVDGDLEPDRYGGVFVADEDDAPVETAGGALRAADDTGPKAENAAPTNFRGDRYLFDGTVTDLEVAPRTVETDVNLYLDERFVFGDDIVGATS